MRATGYNNASMFEPQRSDYGYSHRIFMNPCITRLITSTHEFLRDGQAGYVLREWVDKFARRKQHKTLIELNPVYGDTSTVWLRCSSPRSLPMLLGSFPSSNYVSVMYGSQFSYPEVRLSVLDVSSLSSAMSLSLTADGMNTVVMASPNSSNFDDFQRIITAMIFPVQI